MTKTFKDVLDELYRDKHQKKDQTQNLKNEPVDIMEYLMTYYNYNNNKRVSTEQLNR